MENTLNAGFARRIISPPKGIYLIGYGDRIWGNRGIHDELSASALAFDDGKQRCVVVACDLLAINEYTFAEIANLTNENIILCCSHTHSGPIVYSHKGASRKNKRYLRFLVKQITESIFEAVNTMEPVSLYWGQGTTNIAVNRRERKAGGHIEIGNNPKGKVDRSINILHIRKLDGKPIANIVNIACHNVVLGPRNRQVSADWAGNMRRRIETTTNIPCIFIQGAGANLNPDHEWGERDFDAVDRIGKKTASDVLVGLADLIKINGSTLTYKEKDICLPLETQVSTDKPPRKYRNILSKKTGIPIFMVETVLNHRYPWKTQILSKNGYWSVPMKTVVVTIGNFIWIGLGAEVFCEIGLEIKAHSRSPFVFISSLTNGCIGYLPTEEEHKLGGYEVDLAPFFYRLPGRFQQNAHKLVIQEMLNLF